MSRLSWCRLSRSLQSWWPCRPPPSSPSPGSGWGSWRPPPPLTRGWTSLPSRRWSSLTRRGETHPHLRLQSIYSENCWDFLLLGRSILMAFPPWESGRGQWRSLSIGLREGSGPWLWRRSPEQEHVQLSSLLECSQYQPALTSPLHSEPRKKWLSREYSCQPADIIIQRFSHHKT